MNLVKKLSHPVAFLAKILFDLDLELVSFTKVMKENCRRLHAHVRKYVQDRKNGVTKSQMNGYDLLSVFLEEEDIFNE